LNPFTPEISFVENSFAEISVAILNLPDKYFVKNLGGFLTVQKTSIAVATLKYIEGFQGRENGGS
jgi:hypothetical protein